MSAYIIEWICLQLHKLWLLWDEAWNMKRYLCHGEVGMVLLDVRRIDFWKKTFQILMVLMNPCY